MVLWVQKLLMTFGFIIVISMSMQLWEWILHKLMNAAIHVISDEIMNLQFMTYLYWYCKQVSNIASILTRRFSTKMNIPIASYYI